MTRVAVIGAGIVGAAIAYELSAISGLTISLFDGQEPGQGATGAALGILMAVISQKTKGRGWHLRETSLQRYRTLLPELEAATGEIIPVNRHGLVKILRESDWLRWEKLQAIRNHQGYPLELWNREQTQEKLKGYPLDYGQIEGAIYSPWDWQIQPQGLTQALVKAGIKRGVQGRFQQLVKPLSSLSTTGHCSEIETDQGNFPVDYVIITAGLGSALLTQGENSSELSLQLEPVIGQAFFVQLAPSLNSLNHWRSVLTTEDIHLVPLSNDKFWLGATVEFPLDCPNGFPNDRLREELWQKAIAYYPFLKEAKIINYWSGQRPRPVGESAPVIRPLANYDNVLIACGHYRNGVLLAPATAQEVVVWLKTKLGINTNILQNMQ